MMYKVEDNRLETYRQICATVAAEDDSDEKTAVLKKFFEEGIDQKGFKGDLLLWVKMLLPNSGAPRNFKLRKNHLLKLFSQLFECNEHDMLRDLERDNDISEILRKYFIASVKFPPLTKSYVYLQDVEDFFQSLEVITNEDDQFELLKNFCSKLTAIDLRTIVRLILKEDNFYVTARHVLDAIAIMAYPTYVSKRDLEAVVQEYGCKIMQSAHDRQLQGKKYIRYWEICGFLLVFVFVYTFLLYLRYMTVGAE